MPAERDVERWLSTQDAYTLHKPVRRHFKRRCVVVGGPNQQWQADLVDMSRLKTANDGTTFLLTVIDVFSKRAWCIPLKSKSAASLVAAFRRLLNDVNNNRPTTLQTDKGSEFLNRPLQRLLKEYGVHHFATHNEETKASVVERFNRSLKTRMWRYFTKKQTIRYVDALQDFVRSYNDSYHRSIGMAPSAVNGANQETVWQRLYGHDGGGTPKYRVGDRVRISKAKRHFEKGYMANWTEELFTIVDAHRSDPPVLQGHSIVDLRRGFESLYVYSSVVEPRIVGDKIAPLLRIVPITGRHGEMVAARFDHVQYMPVLSREFEAVEIEIRDDTGRPVPFERGKVTMTLHLRRHRRTGLF